MKVPQPVRGRTNPSSLALGYASNRVADTSGIGVSMERLGASLEAYGQKKQAAKKFDVLRRFSDWDTAVATELDEMRRQSPDDDATYFDRASATIADRETKFVSEIEPEFQEEFLTRARERANAYRINELEFDNKKKDSWFAKGISMNVERSKTLVDANPDLLERERQANIELILSSGLSEDAKADAVALARGELEKAGYRRRAVEEERRILDNPQGIKNFVNKVFGNESSMDPKAYPKDKEGKRIGTAGGLGGFIDSTWAGFIRERHPDLYGEGMNELKMDERYMREATEWYAEKNAAVLQNAGVPVNEGTLYLAHFADGPKAAEIYNSPTGTPIENVMSALAMKNNPNLAGKTTDEVVKMFYDKMGTTQGYSKIDEDPAFANVPLEDRLTMRADAQREVKAELTTQAKERQDAIKQMENEILIGLEDGRAGYAELDAARQRGLFSDFEDLRKAKGILERGEADGNNLRKFVTKLAEPGSVFSQSSTDDRAGANAFAKKADWIRRLSGDDPEQQQLAFAEITALAQDKRLIAPDVMNYLTSLAQDPNWSRARKALDVMLELSNRAPLAYAKEVTDAEAHMVSLYNLARTIHKPENLQQIVQTPRDAAEISRRKALGEGAGELLKTYGAEDVYNNFKSTFTFGETEPPLPGVLGVLHGEFALLFKDNYSRLGDEDAANQATIEQLGRNWGFSQNKVFMKYPPEKYLDPFEGSHDYVYAQARKQYGAEGNDQLYLVPDNQTVLEVENRKQQSGPYALGNEAPVSYKVSIIRDGQWFTSDKRFTAKRTPEMIEHETSLLRLQTARDRAFGEWEDAQEKLTQAQGFASIKGNYEIPAELFDNLKAASKRIDIADDELRSFKLGDEAGKPQRYPRERPELLKKELY